MRCSGTGKAQPSPLDATWKLVKMLLRSQRTSKNLIWRLIRVEQERLVNEVRTLSNLTISPDEVTD